MNNEFANYSESTFDSIKHIDNYGNEYWEARELQIVLEYKEWRFFEKVINKAEIACFNSGREVNNHFGVNSKMVQTGDSIRKIIDYKLSRYACYLIVQNGNPKNKVIGLGQTYFAVQTRKMELTEEEYEKLSEDEKRLYRRKQIKDGNYLLNKVASKSGAKNFDKFHNSGYRGLYNSENAGAIAKRKGLRYREDILDNMGSDELIANSFRISQTEQSLRNNNINKESEANNPHFRIGKNIREVIKKNGGTMPENLPTPDWSLKELEKEQKRKVGTL
ncbi:MAG: DNA damage-inducible protein D [Bacilli bacterium]|nr:DNA damage-inducible protein D [Bacilli bacterium]MDD3304931.1 DNA damage-inducible protein D [Bacilli bacterium]MDD4054146.1 DNA damage-inducible protein D [Bacilli bacterium]